MNTVKNFEPKILDVDYGSINKTDQIYTDFAKSLNNLADAFKKSIGRKPDTKEIIEMLDLDVRPFESANERKTNEKRLQHGIIKKIDQLALPRQYWLDELRKNLPKSEPLNEYLKTKFLREKVGNSKGFLLGSGLVLNFEKLLGLTDFPDFDHIHEFARAAAALRYKLFGGYTTNGVISIFNCIHEDFSNLINESGVFDSSPLYNKIVERFTIKTQTQAQNDAVQQFAIICQAINKLKESGISFRHITDHSGGIYGLELKGIKLHQSKYLPDAYIKQMTELSCVQ